MEKLNQYLQELVSKQGQELHLEPNKQPYVVTSGKKTQISNAPLPGAQINTMIFALIPNEVKKQLPDNPEVEFIHPHNLGDFSFLVKKSPSGFNVTISPSDSLPTGFEDFAEESEYGINNAPEEYNWNPAANVAPKQEVESEDESLVELNSPPQEKGDFMSEESISEEILGTSDYVIEYSNESEIEIEVEIQEDIPANISSQELNSSYQPQIKTEEAIPVIENYNQEQSFESTHLKAPPNDYSPNLDNSKNMQNKYNSQYPIERNSEPVVKVNEPIVQNVKPQQPMQKQRPQAPVAQRAVPQKPPVAQQQAAPKAPAQPVAPPPAYVEPVKAAASVVAPNPQAKAKMDALFHKMAKMGASDLHMSVSVPPMVRNDGKIAMLDASLPAFTPAAMKEILESIMPQKNIEEFAERNDTDFAYEIKGLARFRANIFMDRKGMGGVFRIIPSDIMTAEDLNLSPHIMNLCDLSKGLVVVTGPTGSGKSTTLCAMVDSINKKREDHIITIEDPIEFTHENQKCLVNQREVHNHTDSFKDALRAALREDPDILLVGEMRDLETISIAIETAETGHLVFGTLHTTTAASTVDRIIDQFPADRQQQVRVMLSESLRGVIAQTLLPKVGGGRIAALEVLIVTPAISNLIREGKTFQIPSAMQTGKNKGMVMLNDALMELVNKGLVEPKDAYVKAVDKEGFEMLLKRSGKRI